MENQSLWLLCALPLVGSALAGLLHFRTLSHRRATGDEKAVGPGAFAPVIACAAVLGAFVVALLAFFDLMALEPAQRVLQSSTWDWIRVADFEVGIAIRIDPLSSVMTLVVTGVGFLIHVYSAGYMKGDPGYAKFFAYLNLFLFAMLLLVGSSSLLGLFIGWEGVGLCSFLLIGFWYQKGWPAEAAQKAFVVNRIGDACFLVGSFLLVRLFGTLDLATIAEDVPAILFEDVGFELALAALLLFGGACGKSAQLPLFTWLPDAMAGPTPVSALIHAATMVTAGVYLLVRLNPLYAANPGVLLVIGIVGAATAFVGATSALCQRDIKKVLAYSTVSQLGYMFLAVSTGAFAGAIFHLVTHAFFKGLLFLGSGSVIHGMHEEQDMHKMGGLRRHMPQTYLTFVIGAAALSGLPLLSGFFSKDGILAAAFARGDAHIILWLVGLITAALTAFYTWRMVALTFFGQERFDAAKLHPHESPSLMTVPLWILAVLSAVGGVLNLPHVLPAYGALEHWLKPVTASGTELLFHSDHAPVLSTPVEWALLGLGAILALVFAHKGFHGYTGGTERDERFAKERPALQDFFGKAWGIDDSYTRGVVEPVAKTARAISEHVDAGAIDGTIHRLATGTLQLGSSVRQLADGSLKSYALWIGSGAALFALFWMWG